MTESVERENAWRVQITVPWPISINSYYRSVNGRSILSKRGREYKEFSKELEHLAGSFSEEDRLMVSISLFPPSRRLLDIDNYGKSTIDLLQASGIIPNDNQIDRLHIHRKEVIKGGKAVIQITRID